MPRPITVRMPIAARTSLDEVHRRTQRPIAWLLSEAITDAGQAYALDSNALSQYAIVGANPARTSFHPSAAAHAVLAVLHGQSGLAKGVLTRAAWVRWTQLHSMDEIVAFGGGVRPATEGRGVQ